jgi:hypothetical protein
MTRMCCATLLVAMLMPTTQMNWPTPRLSMTSMMSLMLMMTATMLMMMLVSRRQSQRPSQLVSGPATFAAHPDV